MVKKRAGSIVIHQLVIHAMLAAISIIMGKYLAINLGPVLRLSFENTPIIFAGLAFGPAAAIVAVVADLLGCILVGYEINILVTAGAFAIGLISGSLGLLFKFTHRIPELVKIIVAVSLSHVVGSVVIKTFGLSMYYDMPFMLLMAWRFLNYLLVGAVECVFLYALLKNKAIKKMIGELMPLGKTKSFSSYANSFQAVTVPGLERISALLSS